MYLAQYSCKICISSTFKGIFANGHIPYEYRKRKYHLDLPTLSEMTEAAIKVLKHGDKGFFLLVRR